MADAEARGDQVLSDVDALVTHGASCGDLYAYRNMLDPKDSRRTRINDELRRIGCFNSQSERMDGGPASGIGWLEPLAYTTAYQTLLAIPLGSSRNPGHVTPNLPRGGTQRAAQPAFRGSVPGLPRRAQ